MENSKYKELNLETLKEYLKEIESIKEYFGSDELDIKEVGDGNLNFVYIVASKQDPKKTLIVKQAVPYLRIAGDGFPLSKDRMTYEIRALKKESEITPNFVPKIYAADEEMSAVVMEFLGEHIIMRKGLIEKKIYPKFANHISTFLAENLFKTSSLSLSSKEKRDLISDFNFNTELCKLTEDFVFTFAFMEHETNDDNKKNRKVAEDLFKDMEFKKNILKLKYKFMTKADALIHGDLHTGSIMINEKETFVIDPEFAFVGPFGFDIGAVVANLCSAYISHFFQDGSREYRDWILQTIEDLLSMFHEKFLELWNTTGDSALVIDGFIDEISYLEYKEEFLKEILRESIGFAGAKMARRVFGIAGVEEVRGIKDPKTRAEAEKRVLELAKKFVMRHEYIDEVGDVIKMIKG